MENFKGYVLQAELARTANISLSIFRQLKGIKFKKMGNLACIKKDTLPAKYQAFANDCIDLEFYASFSYLSQALGMSKDYLTVMENYKNRQFDSLRVSNIRLFKLSEIFIEKICAGLTPFKIRKDEEELASERITMQNIEIGFY